MNNIKLKANKLLFTSMFLLLQTHIISAQELYTYLGKSSSSLTVKLGKPDYESQKGTMLVYKYRITSNESQTFGIQNGKIIVMVQWETESPFRNNVDSLVNLSDSKVESITFSIA
jgi:hypothetical protein